MLGGLDGVLGGLWGVLVMGCWGDGVGRRIVMIYKVGNRYGVAWLSDKSS